MATALRGAADKLTTPPESETHPEREKRPESEKPRARSPERARPAVPLWNYRPAGPNQVKVVAPVIRRRPSSQYVASPPESSNAKPASVVTHRCSSLGVTGPFRVCTSSSSGALVHRVGFDLLPLGLAPTVFLLAASKVRNRTSLLPSWTSTLPRSALRAWLSLRRPHRERTSCREHLPRSSFALQRFRIESIHSITGSRQIRPRPYLNR